MSKKPLILGIESSCDETAASIISEDDQGKPIVLSNIVSSQVDVHKKFGGVVPELAARSHLEKIDLIVQKAIEDSGISIKEIDAVASTAGPGLIVCLSVGLSFGKAFAVSLNKPFIAVNHLEGHALSPKLNSKLLGIEFPGGPQIEVLAKKGNSNKYDLPKPIFNKGGCNLSFAGLKTAILKITKQIKTDQEKFDLAASFQKTVIEILYKKTKIAFDEFEEQIKPKNKKFVVAGGVAANKKIRNMLIKLCEEKNYEPIFPPIDLCGDNAAMIAMVGLEKFKLKQFDKLDYPAKPRWPLDEDAVFLKGAGVKL